MNTPSLERGAVAQACLSVLDLRIVAALAEARFTGEAEERRIAVLQEVIGAEIELQHALTRHARRSLAEYRGSHTRWELEGEAVTLFMRLARYGETVNRAVAEFGDTIRRLRREADERRAASASDAGTADAPKRTEPVPIRRTASG